MENRLARWVSRIQPTRIIDIGAHKGEMSKLFHRLWPNAHIIAIEANKDHISTLESLGKWITVHHALLGDEEKIVEYYRMTSKYYIDTGNSIYVENTMYFSPGNYETIKKKMSTLDNIIVDKLPHLDIIKMDVQGAELDIIRGGERIINNARILIIEVSILQYNKGAPLFDTIYKELSNRGWVLVDIIENHYSTHGDLLQIDIMVIKDGDPLIPKGPF